MSTAEVDVGLFAVESRSSPCRRASFFHSRLDKFGGNRFNDRDVVEELVPHVEEDELRQAEVQMRQGKVGNSACSFFCSEGIRLSVIQVDVRQRLALNEVVHAYIRDLAAQVEVNVF